jgi:CRP-like cAMP-binding protein
MRVSILLIWIIEFCGAFGEVSAEYRLSRSGIRLHGWAVYEVKDAISTDRHHCDAIALEDSEVCEIPFVRLEGLFGDMPTLLRHFHRMMSQEITREQNVMLLLGNMRAEQRFAAFLVNLSSRYAARGYSSTGLQLRMSREDIGSYLELTIESISRRLSKYKKQGLLKVSNRALEIVDVHVMKAVAARTQSFALVTLIPKVLLFGGVAAQLLGSVPSAQEKARLAGENHDDHRWNCREPACGFVQCVAAACGGRSDA